MSSYEVRLKLTKIPTWNLTLTVSFQGWLPKSIVNQALPRAQLDFTRNLRRRLTAGRSPRWLSRSVTVHQHPSSSLSITGGVWETRSQHSHKQRLLFQQEQPGGDPRRARPASRPTGRNRLLIGIHVTACNSNLIKIPRYGVNAGVLQHGCASLER